MGRILAIDYGRKRTGIAVTDTLQIVANGLTTVPTHQLLTFLKQYVAKEPVERIVVGLPKQMNNEPSESMRYIKPFLAQQMSVCVMKRILSWRDCPPRHARRRNEEDGAPRQGDCRRNLCHNHPQRFPRKPAMTQKNKKTRNKI